MTSMDKSPAKADPTGRKKFVDKRNWREYEEDLISRKRKIVEFFIKEPTKEELEQELEEMNRGKRGKRFEIPDSIICFFHFMKVRFGTDDRTLAIELSHFLSRITGKIREEFDHSAIVKRRGKMEIEIPFEITSQNLEGKTLYFDGMRLRVGRGGYYKSKEYKTPIRYLRVGVFTTDEGKTVDFVIGDEHDAEVNMVRKKMPQIKKSKAKVFVSDGALSTKDIVANFLISA